MVDLKKIIKDSREEGIKDFDSKSIFTNTDVGKRMIEFCSRNLDVKKVSDWGRDEDTDRFIGLDKSGWIEYIQHNENGDGAFKIISEETRNLADNDIFNFLQNDCTNKEFMDFISACNKILVFYD